MEKQKNDFYLKNSDEIVKKAKEILPNLSKIYKEEGINVLIEYVYENVNFYLEKSGLKEKAICSKNSCSFCCHDNILMSELELEYIRKRLKEHKIKPDKKRSKLQNSIKDFEQLKWVDKACPYLSSTDGKGICTIYEIRPIVCRAHNSIDKTVDLCNKSINPNSSIQEGKLIEVEAILLCLMMIKSIEKQEDIKLVPIYKIF